MRGTDLVLMVSILLGCSWWLSNGVKYGWRHRYQNIILDMKELKSTCRELVEEVNNLQSRVQRLENGKGSVYTSIKDLLVI